jgi:nicotinate-nucleotide adenylyltransferase
MCAAETAAPRPAVAAATRQLRRLGVLGGTFDPVHPGHTVAARFVQQALALERVLLIPCGQPVHRHQPLASAPERCAMVALALAGEPQLQLDRRECQTNAPSYTIDTITALQQEQPDVSWHLLVGADAFLGLPSWKQWQQLLDRVNLVVRTRPGFAIDEALMAPELLAQYRRRRVDSPAALASISQGAIVAIDVRTPDLSSTQVRELLKTGGNLGSILHPAVAQHIRTHGLYLPGDQD